MRRFVLLITLFLLTTQAYAAVAIFAGGCFWCMQSDFDKVPGVISTTAGYTGGDFAPTYSQVSSGTTSHVEAVEVEFDPNKVSYSQLLNYYWHNIDPSVKEQQFCDKGKQYRSIIFYSDTQQQQLAQDSLKALQRSGKFKDIYTEIVPAKTFYPAESYHQKYYQKNPIRYKYYRYTCGRDQRLKEIWGTTSH